MRGKNIPKRKLLPDSKYNSVLVAKLIRAVMKKGKRTLAQSIVYKAFEDIEKKTKKDGLEVFDLAMKNVMPIVEVKSRRVGGANYQIPVEVRGDRKTTLAFRWMLGACRSRQGKPMYQKLAQEILDASTGQGEAMKKREDVHRMAEANRAFAHFA